MFGFDFELCNAVRVVHTDGRVGNIVLDGKRGRPELLDVAKAAGFSEDGKMVVVRIAYQKQEVFIPTLKVEKTGKG